MSENNTTTRQLAAASAQTTNVGVDAEQALEQKILQRLDDHESRSEKAGDPLIGRTIAERFTIESKIGVGGMGAVYRARQKGMDRSVAIKVLLQEYASNETVVKRFHLEALAVSKLKHPNTISIFDFGQTDDGVLYIAMEFLDGRALEQAIRLERQLSVNRALHVMRQVCLSLAEAHAAGIVHRDLKPDNIFLVRVGGDHDFAKVLDFGVAKLKAADTRQGTLTQAGVIFGTPKYMSPEQSRSLELDPRSDIYSLGVILFEMLTGVAPFQAENPLALLIQHVQTPPPRFAEVRPELTIPLEVEALVRKALAKNPNDRQQSCAELIREIDELQALLRGRPEFDVVLTRENVEALGIPEAQRASLTHLSGSCALSPLVEEAPTTTSAPVVVPRVARSRGIGRALALALAVLVLSFGGFAGWFLFVSEPLPKAQQELYSFENFSTPVSAEIPVSVAVIQSTPSGAEVWINGQNTGRNTAQPFVIERLTGSKPLRVELRHPKFKPYKTLLAFNTQGTERLNWRLDPLTQTIQPPKPQPTTIQPKPQPQPNLTTPGLTRPPRPRPRPRPRPQPQPTDPGRVIDLKRGYK